MPAIKTTYMDAPSYWASYFVNGDASGLRDDEKTHADAWLARYPNLQVMDAVEDSERFTWSYQLYDPMAARKGGDVMTYLCQVVER